METTSGSSNTKSEPQTGGSRPTTRGRAVLADPVAQLLKRQHGVITRSQAQACGLDDKVVDRRIASGGPWQRLLPGVYLTVTGTPTIDQLDTAALLYAGRGSVVTGAAALRRHGVRIPSPTTVDVLISAKRRRKNAGFVAIRLTTRMPEHVCYQGPVQFALPARAAADSVRWLDDLASVRAIVAGVVQTRMCTIDQLTSELRSGPVQGSAHFRAALDEVTVGIRSSTEAEFKDLLKRGNVPQPVFNARLFCGDEFIAEADAWWPDAGVAAEVDSKEWHLSPKQWEQTMTRHAKMTALGILVLHFTPRQIKYEPEQVLAIIRKALASRNGHRTSAIRTLPPLA